MQLTAAYVRQIQWMLRVATRALAAAETHPESAAASSAERLREAIQRIEPRTAVQSAAPAAHAAHAARALAPTLPAEAPQGSKAIWEGLFREAVERIGVPRALTLLAEVDRG